MTRYDPSPNDLDERPDEDDATAEPPRRRRRTWRWIGAGLLVIALAAGGFLWWFFKDDAPDAVDIDQATGQLDATDGTDAAATNASVAATTAASANAGIAGTWTVDTSIGEFSFEDSTGTFVGFRVAEELSGIGSTTAVGRTPTVTGTLEIDATTVTAVEIEADMSEITTNDSRRDDQVQGALETGNFPTATFVLSEPIELGDEAAAGETVRVDATGDLTVHGVTRPVTIPLEARLVEDTVVVVGSIDIVFADFGVEVPSAPIVLSVDGDGEMEFQLFFTR